MSNTGLRISQNHEFYLREHILTMLAATTCGDVTIKGTHMVTIPCHNKQLRLACGRRQARVVEGIQESLGTPVFRSALPSIFALSIIMWHHQISDHHKLRAKSSLMRHGWIFSDLDRVLRSCERICGRCIKDNATSKTSTF